MRIRKETSKWSVKTFLKIAVILLIIFNTFYLLTAWLDNALNQMNTNYILMFCILYPVLLAAIGSTSYRTGTLYINDYEAVTDFRKLLEELIRKENMVIETETPDETLYRPVNRFFNLFNAWGGSEKLRASWKKEIVLSGSIRKISAIEDILTWNKTFK
ncbi:MAG: hypothetical protein KF845_08010 [Cyclobacteriaceae bacterium]|nr:hypothetical protein [Cyclobacteriaceae bacterium]